MKKNNYLLIAAFLCFCVTITSCSDDDNASSSDLVGEWTLVRSVGYYKDFEESRWDDEWDDTYNVGEDVIKFKADGTFVMSVNDDAEYAKWKLKGNSIIITWPTDEDDDEHTEEAKILNLTGTELIVESYYKNQYEEEYSKNYYQRID